MPPSRTPALALFVAILDPTHPPPLCPVQDVERGTFSHRHAVVHDQKKFGDKYSPLKHIDPSQAQFQACNSSLSEFGVLGFELGYSLENPASLVMWEAQFGDFANTAQCMIDQFICCGEQKWLRQSGLVMLLPHGYEGQGPEHSSARLERFLQLCDDDEDVPPAIADARSKQSALQSANMQVCNVTTPANYFHLLRRQLWRDFRKPLVVMSPKSLLRHRLVKSDLEDFLPGTRFQRLLADSAQPGGDARLAASDAVKKLVFCTGKVYFDLIGAREASNRDASVAISRVEQISPFPFDKVGQARPTDPGPSPPHSTPTSPSTSPSPSPGGRGDPKVPECRGGVVPGGAQERGCVAVLPAAHRHCLARRAPTAAGVRRPGARRVDGDGPRLVAHQRAQRTPRERAGLSADMRRYVRKNACARARARAQLEVKAGT